MTQKLPSKNLFNNIWMESETLFGSAASWIYGKKRHSSICYIISFTFFFVAQSFIVQAVIIMLKFFKVNLQSWNGVFFALIFIFCLAHSMLVAETDQANKTSVIIYFFKYNSTFLMKRFLKVWIFTPKLTKISNGTFEYLRLQIFYVFVDDQNAFNLPFVLSRKLIDC